MIDTTFMQMAISLAGQAKGFTSPNPCVGAVLVKNGRVVGTGFHRAAGMPHAEVEAIDDADQEAEGATIYVTLEPCNHFGKTPPCTHKILDAKIAKVVVGCKDPNPYVSGGGIEYLRQQGVEVAEDVLKKECHTLIEDFIWYTKSGKRPFVTLKCAATLDGAIATSKGDSQWITSNASRRHGHSLRHQADAILIGSGTLLADDPSLTTRIDGLETKDPARVVLDTRLTIKEDAKILTLESSAPTIIVTGPNAPADKIAVLKKKGVVILQVPLQDQRLDLNEVMIKLGQMSVVNLLIEGGGTIAGEALQKGIVNKVMYFIAPKILGGSDGTPVFKGKGPELIKDVFALKDIDILRFEDDVLIQGYLK